MFKQIWNMACEDDDNEQLDPLRVVFLSGALAYLCAGIALTTALLHRTWFTHDAVDMQNFGLAIAAWATGLAGLLTGAGAGVMMKAKGDAAK